MARVLGSCCRVPARFAASSGRLWHIASVPVEPPLRGRPHGGWAKRYTVGPGVTTPSVQRVCGSCVAQRCVTHMGTAWDADPGVLSAVAPPPTSPTTLRQPAAQPSLWTAPELRPSPTEMSIPQLLQYVVGADRPTDAPRTCTDCLALARTAMATLPTGLRLWLQLEGLSARDTGRFKGLVLLSESLGNRIFASAASRLHAVCTLLSSHGIDPAFVERKHFGISDDWGRAVYHFDDDVSALTVVLSAVDQFVTLCSGPLPSRWMVFDPTARFLEPLDWETGMPHRAAERAQWERLPGFSDWAKNMLRHHFTVRPRIPVRGRISKNGRALRKGDPVFDAQQHAFVKKKIAEDVLHRVVRQRRFRPKVVSAIFCVPKAGKGDPFRKVENMGPDKDNFDPVPFKLETMKHFPDIFRPNHFIFKLDFKAAYHNFLVRSCLRELFGLEFEGKFFTYRALPFAFRMSAFWLHKMVKIVATHLRAQGFAVLPYMDDGGYGEITFVLAVFFRNYVVTLWESLGLRFSATDGKCLPTPAHSARSLRRSAERKLPTSPCPGLPTGTF